MVVGGVGSSDWVVTEPLMKAFFFFFLCCRASGSRDRCWRSVSVAPGTLCKTSKQTVRSSATASMLGQ